MSVLWIIVGCLAVLAWVLTIADIFRRRYPGPTAAGWIALVVILPFVGSAIYWFTRKPTTDEAEQQYLAEADRRHSAETRRF
jgi:hypothetical protein